MTMSSHSHDARTFQHARSPQPDSLTNLPTLPFDLGGDSDILDAPLLNAIADLAESRGAVRFTPGGGVLFDTPATRAERAALPTPRPHPPRLLELPSDRFTTSYENRPTFRTFVDRFTLAHSHHGYRMVIIPLDHRLSAPELRAVAEAAEAFGHGTIRLTADVSIRLPNVPLALLRPLFETLQKAGLGGQRTSLSNAA